MSEHPVMLDANEVRKQHPAEAAQMVENLLLSGDQAAPAAGAYDLLGQIYLRAGDLPSAREAFRKHFEVHPDSPFAPAYIGFTEEILGNTAEARAWYGKSPQCGFDGDYRETVHAAYRQRSRSSPDAKSRIALLNAGIRPSPLFEEPSSTHKLLSRLRSGRGDRSLIMSALAAGMVLTGWLPSYGPAGSESGGAAAVIPTVCLLLALCRTKWATAPAVFSAGFSFLHFLGFAREGGSTADYHAGWYLYMLFLLSFVVLSLDWWKTVRPPDHEPRESAGQCPSSELFHDGLRLEPSGDAIREKVGLVLAERDALRRQLKDLEQPCRQYRNRFVGTLVFAGLSLSLTSGFASPQYQGLGALGVALFIGSMLALSFLSMGYTPERQRLDVQKALFKVERKLFALGALTEPERAKVQTATLKDIRVIFFGASLLGLFFAVTLLMTLQGEDRRFALIPCAVLVATVIGAVAAARPRMETCLHRSPGLMEVFKKLWTGRL